MSSIWDAMLNEHVDPGMLGENLRHMTFPGEGYGCYSNFEVRSDAEKWDKDRLAVFWSDLGYGVDLDDDEAWGDTPAEIANMGDGYSFWVDGFHVDACWFWDGDGVLVFRVTRDGETLRTVHNSDCKKSYTWTDV